MQRYRFDARARSLGMTGAQWRMIALIQFFEGSTQSDIASKLEISNATAGRIVDRLEQNGWVERRRDPVDLRANRLYLTPAAAPVLEQLTVLGLDEEGVALDGLNSAQRAELTFLLDHMIANMVAAKYDTMPGDNR